MPRRKATLPKGKTTKPAKSPAAAPPVDAGFPTVLGPFPPVALQAPPSDDKKFDPVKWLQRTAMKWVYIARNRRRWNGVESLTDEQAKSAREVAGSMGFGYSNLLELARARLIQVSIPYRKEAVGWESRIFPWEFFLSVATRELRGATTPLTVLRQLKRDDSPARPFAGSPKRVLYVECAPGKLKSLYSFDSERALVQANLLPDSRSGGRAARRLEWIELINPTREELEREIRAKRPDIVHLAGFDTHQGYQLLDLEAGDLMDGVLVRDDSTEPGLAVVKAEDLAKILTLEGKHRPRLVSCSMWNSAPRIAALLVAQGARAAIGFQDTFDDGLAEFFFAAFYRRYRTADWDLRDAFTSAWERVRQQPSGLVGTGLVLWSEAPLVGRTVSTAAADKHREDSLKGRLEAESGKILDSKRVTVEHLDDYISLDIKSIDEMNYSLLHNKQPLFERFTILKKTPRRLVGIEVFVELSAGEGGAVFRQRIDLEDEKADLKRAIDIPLTAPLLRAIRETVVSSLFVEVKWGDHVLRRETRRVRLLPADQWCFADKDKTFIWLPSFVLPRDAAVRSLLERAQRYVRVLRDDPTAGFEGYQAIDEERDDPTEDVDLQVQAIWSAIVHEWGLAYTNPPPTYSRGLESQRLRTPSAILRERFGTCIDTSLLFAACLEMIDVYPVIFMLDDHAFPGYWRTDEAHDAFLQMSNKWVSDMSLSELGESRAREAQERGWVLDKGAFAEILRQIDEGKLVPVESTMLTEGSGFWPAVEAAREDNFDKKKFHSMLDIGRSRTAGVTPLPIGEER